jgi:cell division septation protein DedD
MHHRRVRSSLPTRPKRRLALGMVLTALLTALVLVVPVAGSGPNVVSDLLGISASSSAPDATPSRGASRDAERESPVIMGVDGLDGLPSPAPGTTPEAPTTAPAPEPTTTAPTEEPTTAPAATEPPAPAPAPPATSAPAGAAGQVLALVNQERAAAGCGAVSSDGALAAVALAHSADMRDRGFFSHTNPEGLDGPRTSPTASPTPPPS